MSSAQSNRPKQIADSIFVTYYGKDNPSSKYNPTTKVEEGYLVKGKKEATWTKFYPDGKTPKLIGNYIANEPNGAYTKFYPNGVLKEKGVFSNHHYTDSLCYYSSKGKLESITIYNKNGKQIGETKHFHSNGELALSYEVTKEKIEGNITWFSSTGAILSQMQVKRNGTKTPIIYDEIAFQNNIPSITKGFHAIRLAGPILKDGPFDPNGYNVVYNKQDELYQVGTFKDGALQNGKLYSYDENGMLKSIIMFRDGFYFSEKRVRD